MLDAVEWGEFALGDLFEIKSNPQLDKGNFIFSENGEYPYFTRTVFNNGILGKVEYLDEEHKIRGGCLAVGMIAMQFFYMEKDFYAGQFTKRAELKDFVLTPRLANYFITVLNKKQKIFQATLVRSFEKTFKTEKVQLPIKNGQIDLDFMEKFVAELEARRSAELEAYLSTAGLKDYALNAEEEQALAEFPQVHWAKFNLQKLFGKATRGKRLKSADRVSGCLPFVTAGEADTGISAFIGNQVERFQANTITIDIFGSAKYRNYEYGADDHVAVVHTEEWDKMEVLFATAAIHKAAYTGEFNYGRNFYAKDADTLNIWLPEKDGKPDYIYMQNLLSAVQKRVIKSVVQYADQKIAATAAVRQQR